MFLKTHNRFGKVVLVNLDNVACITDGTITYTNGDEYKPTEGTSDIMDALGAARQVVYADHDTKHNNYC